MTIIPIHVKGNCSDDWAREAAALAMEAVDMSPDRINRIIVVVDRVINIIPKVIQ